MTRKVMTKTKLVFGVGINDADYHITKRDKTEKGYKIVWVCPYYVSWASVLRRCYSEIELIKHPSYIGCSVVNEWLTFSKFKAWMETQDWQGKELDKDILVRGNKVYGPDTCVFVDQKINKFVTERQNDRGTWPIGVSLQPNGKFLASCMDVTSGKRKRLGLYADPESAHEAWLSFKLEQAKLLASNEKDIRVSEALVKRYENYKEQ